MYFFPLLFTFFVCSNIHSDFFWEQIFLEKTYLSADFFVRFLPNHATSFWLNLVLLEFFWFHPVILKFATSDCVYFFPLLFTFFVAQIFFPKECRGL